MRVSRELAEHRALNIVTLLRDLDKVENSEQQKLLVVASIGEALFQQVVDQVELAVKEYANYLDEVDDGEHDDGD